jgi:hypothetical protein
MRKLALASLAFLVAALNAAAGEMDRFPPGQSPVPSYSATATTEPLPVDDPPAGDWRLYGETDYLMWWLREGRTPPLVTTGPAGSQGVLGQPGTSVLYGDDRLQTRHDDRFFGGRFRVGGWLDEEQRFALEAGGIFLERDSTSFKAVSNGSEVLARPYFNAQTGQESSLVFAGPSMQGLLSGAFNGYSRIEFFSEEGNLVVRMADGLPIRLQGIFGGRFLQMRDRIDLTAVSRILPTQSTLESLVDHFRTHDAFYGGQLGFQAGYDRGRWSITTRGLVALGADDQQIRAFGDHLYQTPLVRTDSPGGFSVLPSNTGTFHQTAFDAVYEIGVNIHYRLTRHCQLGAGYTFLGWNNPIRAGDQVDTVVNPSQLNGGALVGPARPSIPFKEDFFWAQGVNVSLEFGW